MLKISASAVILAVAFGLQACSGTQTNTLTPDPAAQVALGEGEIRPMLFVARDADSTIYLYGTVHLRRAGEPWGNAQVRAALARAEDLWTELDMGPEAEAQTQGLVAQYGMAPSDRPLSSWLTPEQRTALSEVTQRIGIPAQALEPMRPWLAGLTLTLVPVMQAGYDPNAGVDRQVENAAPPNARRRFFESAEEQIGFFANLSDDVQVQFLAEAIDSVNEGPETLDQLSAAWEQGDAATLERLVIDEMHDSYPELHRVIFTQRNQAWTEVLTAELAGSGVDFVAVGAGHLVGEDGLVELLRARGVSVERIGQ